MDNVFWSLLKHENVHGSAVYIRQTQDLSKSILGMTTFILQHKCYRLKCYLKLRVLYPNLLFIFPTGVQKTSRWGYRNTEEQTWYALRERNRMSFTVKVLSYLLFRLQIKVVLSACRDETAHAWEDQTHGGVFKERVSRHGKVQSCVGERPSKPGKI